MAKPPMVLIDVVEPAARAITSMSFLRGMPAALTELGARSVRRTLLQSRRKNLCWYPLLSGFLALQVLNTISARAAQPAVPGLYQKLAADRFALEALTASAGAFFQASASEARAEAEGASVQSIQANIAQVEQRLLILRAKYTDAYPDVVEAKEQLAELQRQLERANKRQRSTVTVASPLPDPTVAPESARTSAAQEANEPEISRKESRSAGRKSTLKPVKAPLMQPANHAPAASASAPPASAPLMAVLPEVPNTPDYIAPKASTLPDRVRPPQAGPLKHLVLILLFAFGLLVVVSAFIVYRGLTRKRRELYISDVATLRSMLVEEFDYVGSIPRMRNG